VGTLIPKRGASTPEANGRSGIPRPTRVLLVEDHAPFARAVRQGLHDDGFLVDVVSHDEAADRGPGDGYDAVILDLVRVREVGLALLRRWRREGNCPHVLALTEPGHPVGEADGSLAVPFAFDELLALLRRVRPPGDR
jgi:DNA-binding response OmpR family regulator